MYILPEFSVAAKHASLVATVYAVAVLGPGLPAMVVLLGVGLCLRTVADKLESKSHSALSSHP